MKKSQLPLTVPAALNQLILCFHLILYVINCASSAVYEESLMKFTQAEWKAFNMVILSSGACVIVFL